MTPKGFERQALLISRTRLGLFVRGVTQNRRMASAMGIRTGRVDALTFGLGSGIAGVAGVAREITELQKAESERAESSVAAAMNEVAKPLAHELNNALTVINGHAMLINEDVDASGPVKTGIEQIMNAVKWAAELTSRFEYFARNPKPGLRS